MICPACNTEFNGDACPECGAAVSSFADSRLAAASALLKEGLADQAVEALEGVLSSNPRSYETHSLLGAAYMRMDELELAGHHFERAVWLDSGRAAARYNLAVAYRKAGRLREALEQVRAALAKDPGHAKSQALLRELERNHVHVPVEAPPGSPENRPRAAAPHLEAVQVRRRRMSWPLQLTFGTLAVTITIIVGTLAYRAAFRLLTSPQLMGRDAVLWQQLSYIMGGIACFAGIIAACFQIRGLPVTGALGGAIGLPIGVAILFRGEQQAVSGGMVFGAVVGGAVSVAAAEAAAKFSRLGEWRGTLIWVSLIAAASYVVVGYARQGCLTGRVIQEGWNSMGEAVVTRVPDVEIVVCDPRTKRSYTTVSANAGRDGLPAATQGRYKLRGMPVGYYNLTALDRQTGASFQGKVYVDYAIIEGNSLDIALSMPSAGARGIPSPRGQTAPPTASLPGRTLTQ